MKSYQSRAIVSFGAGVLMTLCGCVPSIQYFTFHGSNYYDGSASHAQLGNLGLRSTVEGSGFQRGAFLSDCGIPTTGVHIDARAPRLTSAVKAFGKTASVKSVSRKLGLTHEELERMSLLVLSLNPRQFERDFIKRLTPDCRLYIQQNVAEARFVTSVVVALDFAPLRETDAGLLLSAELREQGGVVLISKQKKVHSVRISPGAVVAYRTAHFCFGLKPEDGMLVRSDDASFSACPAGYSTTVPAEGWEWNWDALLAAEGAPAAAPASPDATPESAPAPADDPSSEAAPEGGAAAVPAGPDS